MAVPTEKRQANMEALRIAAMFMVVILHYLSDSGALPESGRGLDGISAFAVTLESLCIVAVNAYVLLSGYFLSMTAFRWRRLLRLLLQVLFYTLLIPPALAALGLIPASELTDVYHIWNSVFPVQSGQYWFVTAYVILFLFSPLLNAALEKLEQRRLGGAILGLLVFFCFGKSVSVLQFSTDRYGYDFGWFLCLYLIGGYWRRYGIPFLSGKGRGLLVYLGSSAGIAGMELILTRLSAGIPQLSYYASVPFHYNFILCLTGAMGLFAAFLHTDVPEGKTADLIRAISPATFGVYLIHQQADVQGKWLSWADELTGRIGLGQLWRDGMAAGTVPRFALCLLVQTLLVFWFCIALDRIRSLLFLEKRRKRP